MASSTDRIEKTTLLRATPERVWRAITDAKEFGTWFGAELDGPFVAGEKLTGRIVPTKVDADIARAQEPFSGTPFTVWVARIEPKRLFSFRWHPFGPEAGSAEASAPTTLVVFELEEVADGTRLTISESGFDRVPLERRAKAFADNEQGWSEQSRLIGKYLSGDAPA